MNKYMVRVGIPEAGIHLEAQVQAVSENQARARLIQAVPDWIEVPSEHIHNDSVIALAVFFEPGHFNSNTVDVEEAPNAD